MKLTLPDGRSVDAEPIDIEKLDDPPTFVKLKDGSRIRLRIDVIEVVRVSGIWDSEGNPIYQVKTANTMAVLDVPDDLKGNPTIVSGNGS